MTFLRIILGIRPLGCDWNGLLSKRTFLHHDITFKSNRIRWWLDELDYLVQRDHCKQGWWFVKMVFCNWDHFLTDHHRSSVWANHQCLGKASRCLRILSNYVRDVSLRSDFGEEIKKKVFFFKKKGGGEITYCLYYWIFHGYSRCDYRTRKRLWIQRVPKSDQIDQHEWNL